MSSRASLPRIIFDEISLEGLEGVTLSSLWIYLSDTMKLTLPLPAHFQQQVWAFIKQSHEHLSFYELPEERATITLYKRFENLDEYLGLPIVPNECPLLRYKCVPISDGNIIGSCEYYKERKAISIAELQDLSLEAVMKAWGNKFVIVASQEQRYNALTPINVPMPKDFTPIQYCIWEAIGRARYNGETTGGAWSLLHFCKDSTIVFYIKNRLKRHNVITCQSISEKRNDRIMANTLLTLPRFYATQQSSLASLIERLFQLLKSKPEHSMTVSEARRNFPSFENNKTFRRVSVTHLFRRVFETKMVPISEIVPTAKRSKKEGSKERLVQIVSLRNPNLSIEELFTDDSEEKEDIDSESADCETFYNEKHTYVDMPLKDAFYRAVARYGERGCSQSELCIYLSLHHLAVRQIIKKLMREGLLKSYAIDLGRQRISRYVTIQYSNTMKKKKDDSQAVLNSLQCAEEPNLPDNSDVNLADVEVISTDIKVIEFEVNSAPREAITQRQLERKKVVVQAIDKKCIVPVIVVRNLIQSTEKEAGHKDEVCQKSVRRLLQNMKTNKILNIYEITLQYQENIRSYQYVTHPKIQIDHDVIKREVLKLKNSFFLIMEERRVRSEAQAAERLNAVKLAAKKIVQKKEALSKEIINARTHKPPKFLISRYMHEFLFYIIVELNEYQTGLEITEELLQQWQHSEPDLQIRDYMQQFTELDAKPLAYTSVISWRTFIPPLPKYPDKPAGWVYFMDAVERMPLSMFNKIFRVDNGADERLAAYLAHPVRQHYLMRQLPVDLQCQISRMQLQKIYTTVLKLLNHMGLVQVTERKNLKDPLILWVYLNRHTQILDTTPTEASYAHINAERDYEVLKYEFSSFDDVTRYWTTLQRVCVYTKLGFRRGKYKKLERLRELSYVRTVEFDDAPVYDTGNVPGDNLGAAGLGTKLFAHTFRNWSWVVHTSSNPRPLRTGRSKHARPTLHGRKNRLHPSSVTNAGTSLVKRLQPTVSSLTKRSSAKKTTAIRDAIDRDALKNMRTLRVSWRKEEDAMLKIARAVYVYVAAPVPALGLLMVGKICRDIMRRTLGSYNKTCQACVRRIQFIIKNRRHLPEVPTCLYMLQTNEQLQRKYGGDFLKRLRQHYPNRLEYCDTLAKHFILIMNFLYNIIHNMSGKSAEATHFILPDSVTEFDRRFRELPPVIDEHSVQHSNPNTEMELQVAVITNVLHSSLCCTQDKTAYTSQAFEIYKHYSEEVLHTAFSKARSDALVVAIKRKNIQLVPRQLAGPAYLLSSRYRMRLNFLKIPYSVYDAFYAYFETAISTMFGPQTVSAKAPSTSTAIAFQDSKQRLELKSPHLGHLFFMAENLSQNYIKLSIKLPINILTVDAEQRQTLSPTDRMLDHYHSIFDNAPQTEYTKNFESETSERQVRVKFHPANLSYKLHYSPYDIISKLPTRCLHYFCALDHLDQEVDINFSKLHQKDDEHGFVLVECPFNCIMKNSNYINAIERIVQEKKSILNELSEMAPQKLLNMATSGCSVTVQTTNLLTLVRMLESFWREKEMPYERKDLGKMSANVKAIKSIDWHQLCNDILTFKDTEEDIDKNDEYEPTLNKEERIVRAQDVFVVNLPTIYLSANEKLQTPEVPRVIHNGILAPQIMLENDIQREAILQKIMRESYWKYTDNTFETLKLQLDKLNFNAMEQQHLKEVHDFIEKYKFGVAIEELLREFPYEKFLFRALHTLAEHFLIKRVGVATFMYVHKTNIRSWVVHTFHITRLERENLGGGQEAAKRIRDEDGDLEENEASTSKKQKLDVAITDKPGKRVSKPVKRFEDASSDDGNAVKADAPRDVIVLKPQPWMRLNGSINRRVLDRWLGSILTECIARAGCSVQDICLRFPHMLPADIMFLLELLCDLKCIHLTQIQATEVNIFSNYEPIKETIVTEFYNPTKTYLTAHADAVMRLTIFIGNKKYSTEFI